jgi:hypothetical protein
LRKLDIFIRKTQKNRILNEKRPLGLAGGVAFLGLDLPFCKSKAQAKVANKHFILNKRRRRS